MQIGTYVLLRHRHAFRDGQPDLSEALGRVCERQEDGEHELVSVIFAEHSVLTPCVPVELFEAVTLH